MTTQTPFASEQLEIMDSIISRYPRKRSAIMPLLHYVQSIDGYVTPRGIEIIAEKLELHESTISRITTQKFLSCLQGTYEFKYFFSSQVQTLTGGNISSTAIQELILQLVKAEDPKKPLSDSSIEKLLSEKGFVVARRTIAKYRDILKIAPVHLRKKVKSLNYV